MKEIVFLGIFFLLSFGITQALRCSDIYEPVCGVDGKTYQNDCYLRGATWPSGPKMEIAYQGECVSKIPNNCVSRFDGCNTCSKSSNGQTMCTLRYCEANEMKASYCSEYEKSPIPINCSKRYDGCNTCTVVNGTLGSCTEMACVRQQEAKCLEYKPQVEPVPTASIIPAGCTLRYDGCNECQVSNRQATSCTKRYCFRQDTPACLEYQTTSNYQYLQTSHMRSIEQITNNFLGQRSKQQLLYVIPSLIQKVQGAIVQKENFLKTARLTQDMYQRQILTLEVYRYLLEYIQRR